MPITINGDGTITGISTGGLPDGSIATADIADDAVTLAKLSTTGTPGAGNFLRGDNSWQEAGGGWKLLSSNTASDDATIDQTGINRATHPTVAVIISDLLPASDGQALYVRFGDSSGFDTGASDYTHAIQYGDATASNNTFTQANDTTNGFINTDTGGVGNAAGEGVSAILYVSTGHNGGRARMQGTSVCTNGSGNMIRNVSFGHRNDVITLDRIRVYFNSGNIASGNVSFYGLAIS